jgi:hypothetical protein
MSERLNPKLTKRNLAINLPLGEEPAPAAQETERIATQRSSSSYGSSATTTTSSSGASGDQPAIPIKIVNPRLHLIHNGKWIPKQVTILGFCLTRDFIRFYFS